MQANLLMAHLVPLFRAANIAGYAYKFDLVRPTEQDGVSGFGIVGFRVSMMALALNKCWVHAPDAGLANWMSDDPYETIVRLTRFVEHLPEADNIHYAERPVVALLHTRDIGVVRLEIIKEE